MEQENVPVHVQLNRLLSGRVDHQTWAKIRPYMQFFSEDDLEEMDWFGVPSGWHVLNIHEVERILAVPPEWTFEERMKEQDEKEERKKREHRETLERRVSKHHEYSAWQETHLAGLERFHDWIPELRALAWEDLISFDEEAGGWQGTGDRWSQTIWNGHPLLSNSYGNTSVYYSTRENVVRLARLGIEHQRQWYLTEVQMARHIIATHDRGCIGDASARIVVEEDGLDTYLAQARKEPWCVTGEDDHWKTAQQYGLPCLVLTRKLLVFRDAKDREKAFQKRLGEMLGDRARYRYSEVLYHPETTQWFVRERVTGAEPLPVADLSDLFPELMR